MSYTSDIVREQFKAGDDIRDAGLVTPTCIERFDDITYGTDSRWQSLDVYRPKDTASSTSPTAPKALPVIVSVHGGGWVYGDKERYQWYCMDLAARGFMVVNYTYRLAPEHKFPASLEDTCAVFLWTLEHIADYGGDPTRIFAVGDSAGAHILGLFCNLCTNPSYAAKLGLCAPQNFAPRAVALNCGAHKIQISSNPHDLTSALMADFLEHGGNDEELDLIDVGGHITKDFPPAFVMTCDGDFLYDQAFPLVATLRELKVVHELHVYGGVDEPLPHVFHCNMRSEDARRCNDDEARFFARFC